MAQVPGLDAAGGAGAGGGAYEVFMNTEAVNKKALDLVAIGEDNKKITSEFEASTATLLRMGIKGLTHNKFSDAADAIMEETLKNPKRLISYAKEMAASVTRTKQMDEQLADSFSVEGVDAKA